jgi:replicative DNA helicase
MKILAGDVIPYAGDAEEAVISTLLFNGNHIEWLSEILSAEMFYRRPNALIYGAVKSLYDDGKPIDVITVAERLEKTGKLVEAGGAVYLRSMADRVVSTSGLEQHAMFVLDKYIARRLIETGQGMIQSAMDGQTDVMDCLVEAEKKLAGLGDVIAGKTGVATLNDLLKSAYSRMFERIENYKKNIAAGVDTGLYWLNRITGGWHKGNLIVLAGRPAMGKTAVALHFAKAAARKEFHVLMFSLEMSTDELTDRLVISGTDIDSEQFRIGNVESEIAKVDGSINRLYSLPVSVDENVAVTAAYIRARVREQRRKRCDLVIIDYLNLMIPEGRKNRNRENDVSELTRALKMIARESDVPVIVLAQLSRKCEERGSKIPELADLRESGSIEQDADIVMLCFRPGYYWSDDNMPQEYRNTDGRIKRNYGQLIIAKNRHGRTGFVEFAHNDTVSAICDWNNGSFPQNPF